MDGKKKVKHIICWLRGQITVISYFWSLNEFKWLNVLINFDFSEKSSVLANK